MTKSLNNLKLVLILQILASFNMETCTNRNSPLLKGTNCLNTCSQSDIQSEVCKVDNEIIKTQWLNNIIYITPEDYRYINIALSESNSIYIIVSSWHENNERYLYILDNEGYGFFEGEDGNKTPFKKIEISDTSHKGRFESNAFTIKLYSQTDEKEYLLSISKGAQYAELYDLYSNNVYFKSIENVFGELHDVFSYVTAHLKFTMNDNKNTYLLGLLATEYPRDGVRDRYFYLKKIRFNSLNIQTDPTIQTQKILSSYSQMISCYETSTNLNIICFHKNSANKYVVIAYDQELNMLKNTSIADADDENDHFYKCAHFFGETGVFAYFTHDTHLLKFEFKTYSGGSIVNFYENIPSLIIQNTTLNLTFNRFLTLNDIAKVKDKKFYYGGISDDRKILYVISIINYSDDKFMVRIYSFNTYKLLNYRVYCDLGIVIYKNFLAMGTSFNIGEPLTAYSSLIIFSYVNTTDTSTEITGYLFNNNNTKIYDLNIKLTGEFVMENNIFGYVYSGVQIIENCKDLNDIYFAYDNGEKIESSYFLEKNKTVKLIIPKSDVYDPFICLFKYASTVSEPDYDEFNKYPILYYDTATGNTEKENFFFEKTNYVGKYSNYYLYLLIELTESGCGSNCELCYSSDKNKCVTCIYDYYIENNEKICLSEEPQNTENTEIESPTTEVESSKEAQESTETEASTETQESTEFQESTETEASTETQESTEIHSTEKPSETAKINEETEKNEDICKVDEILDNKCKRDITEDQVEEIYSYIKQNLIGNYSENENIVINSDNVVFQISSSEEQKNSNNPNISNIDLGDCEIELKRKNNISESKSLVIFKTDIKSEDKTSTYIQYEVYNPNTLKQLNMSVCENLRIDIYPPISLNFEQSELFSSLSNSGYNLFNENDSFYNDICTPYTTKNGTDILLIDRKIDIYSKNGNMQLCQKDCILEFYNETSKKAKCNCAVQPDKENKNINKDKGERFDKKDISDNFFKTLSNSNFLVLKCYKLAFDFSNFVENIGRIIMTAFFAIIIILLVLYCFKGNKKLHLFLKEILKNNNKNLDKFDRKINHKRTTNKKSDKNNRKNSHHRSNKHHNSGKDKKNKDNEMKNNHPSKKKSENLEMKKNEDSDKIELNKNNFPPKKKMNISSEAQNIISSREKQDARRMSKLPTKKPEVNEKDKYRKISNNNLDNKKPRKSLKFATVKNIKVNLKLSFNNHEKMEERKKSKKSTNKLEDKDKELRGNKKNFTKKPDNLDNKRKRNSVIIFKNSFNEKSNDSLMLDKTENNGKNILGKKISYTDQELNSLEYELAKEYDKRTYLQYYWSLLKKKHLILFTFLPAEDYNLLTIKISLFIISFSLYFTINGFFFTDKSMHNVYEHNGAFKFIYQIPQILYSTIVSALINLILKKLSLSENNILEIKKEHNEETAKKKFKKIENCLKIKFIIFFILCLLFMLFFWYFITCFCSVYKNTQIILIKDTMISFGISMLYPFGLNLLPGILRIPALRAKTDKKLLYKISLIIALI